MSDDPRATAVARVIEPVVTAAGYDLDDISLAQAGRRVVVRIALDADAGITLDAVADVSRAISDALDTSTALGNDPYTLEVGSRGVSAPLRLERHWRRNVGRLVTITFIDRDRAKLTARIVSAADEHATVRPDGGDVTVAIVYTDIRRASVQIEFTKPRPEDADDPTTPAADDADDATDADDADDADDDSNEEEEER